VNEPEFRFSPDVLRLIKARVALGDEDWEIAGRIGCDMRTLDTICNSHGVSFRASACMKTAPAPSRARLRKET
jgi:hypothetical protein